ncbi:unnamed protein product [Clonostachys solani]|uniref:CHAT domain-containing protein n=1 Tax=Clonostachys solani TaxID=160281 RepID=A0A9N9ZIQ9_9HYPO|nr:unnamed protein product [Clonostachys solani]
MDETQLPGASGSSPDLADCQASHDYQWPRLRLLLQQGLEVEDQDTEVLHVDVIEEAIREARRNIGSHPLHNGFSSDLAFCLAHRYENFGLLDDLEETERLFRQVLDSEPDKTQKEPCRLRLARVYCTAAEKTNTLAYAEEAIQLLNSAIKENSLIPGFQSSHHFIFVHTTDLGHLEETIHWMKQAVETANEAVPLMNRILLLHLADYYHYTGGLLSVLEDLIFSTRYAVSLAPENSQERFCRLFELADYLHDLYEKTGVADTLTEVAQVHGEAAELANQLLASTPRSDIDHTDMLLELGRAMYRWYTKTNSAPRLAEAIRLVRQTIDSAPLSSPRMVEQLNLYAKYLTNWSDEIGSLSKLREGIEVVRRLFDLLPGRCLEDDDYDVVSNLMLHFDKFFLLTGEMKYLDQAIAFGRRVVNDVPKDNPDTGDVLYNLAQLLVSRFEQTGLLQDLKELIKLAKYLVSITPDGHPDQASRQRFYASKLVDLCKREFTKSGVDEAIKEARLAADLYMNQGKDATHALITLVRGLAMSFRFSGNREALEEGIKTLKHGVTQATNKENQAYAYSQLSGLLYEKYRDSQALEELNDAITTMRRAINLSSGGQNHQLRNSLYSARLAMYLLEKGQRTHTRADLKEIKQILLDSSTDGRRPQFNDIVTNITLLLRTHQLDRDWQGVFDVSSRMVDLIPTMIPNSLDNSDKQWVLQFMRGVASIAASSALILRKPAFVALDLLERGRGALGSSLEDLRRTDITLLQQSHPELMQRFLHLKNQLTMDPNTVALNVQPEDSSAAGSTLSDFGGHTLLDQRHSAGTQLHRVIEEINTLPGFERFYNTLSEKDVRDAACDGPLVVINDGVVCFEAIIVEQHQIRALPLQHVLHDEVAQILNGGNLWRPFVLEWLWDCVMSPILEALGCSHPVVDDTWLHVWWIPVGIISKFPLHAAGYHHRADSDQTVLSRVISSYSSSIKSIVYGRRRPRQPRTQSIPDRAVLVAMEHTPGHAHLPYATAEISELNKICKFMRYNVIDSSTVKTKSSLLENIQGCTIFHFAGHAYTDQKNPSESCLCLKQDRIKVADLLELDLYSRAPFLAYLSACGTLRSDADDLVDENIHLVSSCQLAGFRHVVGTLWEVNDAICVDVARIMYEKMSEGEMSDLSVARGLHHASRSLRDQWVERVSDNENRAAMKRSAASSNTSSIEAAEGTIGFEKLFIGSEEDARDSRDALLVEEADAVIPLWAPWVHYGV